MGHQLVNFHIDTGAEVTLITEEAYTAIGSPVLGPSKQSLKGPNNEDLQVKGCFQLRFNWERES